MNAKPMRLCHRSLLAAERDISDDEVEILIHILQHFFTDEPDREIVTNKNEIMTRLPAEIEIVKKDDDIDAKTFILSLLADVALADGALMDAEGAVIHQVTH